MNTGTLLETGIGVLFFVLLLAFALHALFVAYHWFTYGSSKQVSLLSLAVYLAGGAILLLTFSIAQTTI
jgi:hypothetical protein